MLRIIRKHLRGVAMIGVAAALTVGGVAAAQGTGSSQSGSGQGAAQSQEGSAQQGGRPGPGGPPMGMGMGMGIGLPGKGLTYAQFHVQKNGQEQTIRLDQGKITAVDESSITLSENDGSEVTIALGDGTKVLGKPGEDAAVSDLSVGQLVTVSGPEGGTAEMIAPLPKKGEGPPSGGKPPTPPSGSSPGGGE